MSWYKKAQENDDDDFGAGKWVAVQDSTWITDIAYSELTGHLDLRTNKGSEYTFEGVTKEDYENFRDAQSKGGFYNRVIKPKYGVGRKTN